MAIFGSSAAANIAKVSFMAKKMKVDVGTITGIAERFSGYSDAARSAQAINALFGKPVIRNPAELVTAFYTLGEGGVVQLVQQKLIESGVEIDTDSAAGRAQLRFLSQQFGVTGQDALRIFGAGEVMSAEEAEAFGKATGQTATPADTAAAVAQFDRLALATVTVRIDWGTDGFPRFRGSRHKNTRCGNYPR